MACYRLKGMPEAVHMQSMVMSYIASVLVHAHEKKRKVYAGRQELWEALDRPRASRPIKGIYFCGAKAGGACP